MDIEKMTERIIKTASLFDTIRKMHASVEEVVMEKSGLDGDEAVALNLCAMLAEATLSGKAMVLTARKCAQKGLPSISEEKVKAFIKQTFRTSIDLLEKDIGKIYDEKESTDDSSSDDIFKFNFNSLGKGLDN